MLRIEIEQLCCHMYMVLIEKRRNNKMPK